MPMIEIAPLVWAADDSQLIARTLVGDYVIRLCHLPKANAILGGFSLTVFHPKPSGKNVRIATPNGTHFSTPGQAADAANAHFADLARGIFGRVPMPTCSGAYSTPINIAAAEGPSRATLEYLAGLSEVQPPTLETDLELLRQEIRR